MPPEVFPSFRMCSTCKYDHLLAENYFHSSVLIRIITLLPFLHNLCTRVSKLPTIKSLLYLQTLQTAS